jgi:hypothetical protein
MNTTPCSKSHVWMAIMGKAMLTEQMTAVRTGRLRVFDNSLCASLGLKAEIYATHWGTYALRPELP